MSQRGNTKGTAALTLAFTSLFAIFGGALPSTAAPQEPAQVAQEPAYLNPIELQVSPDGKTLYVVSEGTNSLLRVDAPSGRITGRVKVGRKPKGIAASPNGKTLYVANEWGDTISEIDSATLVVKRTLAAGWGPTSLVTSKNGKFLYVANGASNSVSVIDLAQGKEVKRFASPRSPQHLQLSRDGRFVFVTHVLPLLSPYDKPPFSELTVIDAENQRVAERILIPGVIELRHIAEAPSASGGYLIIPMVRPKNLGPLIRVEQGWVLTHGFVMVRLGRNPSSEEGRAKVTQVLLDDIDLYFANGYGAAFTPDGRFVLVTASGANLVSVIDTSKLAVQLRRFSEAEIANRLDIAREFVVRRVATQDDPSDVAVAPDGRFAYIANRLADSISVVDLSSFKVTRTIDMGGPREISVLRRGVRLFHNAKYCFQGQFSCSSCHPEDHLDGLAWNLETPQLGRDRVANRTLRNIAETAPYKWNGRNPDLETQCGPRIATFLFRSEGFNPQELHALVAFLESIPLPPNRHRAANGELTEAQERGRAVFFRTDMNDGREIPEGNRCNTCHPLDAHGTNQAPANVGSATEYDTLTDFDTPQLDNVAELAPYLHNGMALTLEEIWTVYNNSDTHGVTSDMRKEQLNDLIEFLKTL